MVFSSNKIIFLLIFKFSFLYLSSYKPTWITKWQRFGQWRGEVFDWKVARKLLFTLLFQLSKSFKEKMTHIHPIKVLYMSTENTQMLFISFFFFYLYPLLNSHSYIIINLSMEYFIQIRKYIFFGKKKFYE